MQGGIYVAAQTVLFLQSLLVGVALGVMYEPFRAVRALVRLPAWLVFVQDILYFVLAAFVTFSFMLSEEAGKIRFALIIGELTGAALYLLTIGELINRLLIFVIRLLKRIIGSLWRRIFAPLLRLLSRPAVFAAKKLKKIFENAKIHLKTRAELVYNQSISMFRKKLKKRKQKSHER